MCPLPKFTCTTFYISNRLHAGLARFISEYFLPYISQSQPSKSANSFLAAFSIPFTVTVSYSSFLFLSISLSFFLEEPCTQGQELHSTTLELAYLQCLLVSLSMCVCVRSCRMNVCRHVCVCVCVLLCHSSLGSVQTCCPALTLFGCSVCVCFEVSP